MYGLLEDPLFTVLGSGGTRRLSLPEVLAGLARGDEIAGFTHLRTHQRFYWHAFLVQLAAHALEEAGLDPGDAPRDEDGWRDLLRVLTPDFPADEPWRLVVQDLAKPAFLQPPVPEGRFDRWEEVAAVGDLDILLSSKNHDVKTGEGAQAPVDTWIYALVTVQTAGGYEGRGIYGVARMNGGYSGRPGIGLVPDVRPGPRFLRDLRVLFAHREEALRHQAGFREEGHRLLWLLPWHGKKGSALPLSELHPWFVEVCRRVRFVPHGDGFAVLRRATDGPRVEGKAFNGSVGDPWIPIRRRDGAAYGNTPPRYDRIAEVLFDREQWALPSALGFHAALDPPEPVALFQVFVRGQGKTEGFHERAVPFRPKVTRLFARPEEHATLAAIARSYVEHARTLLGILRGALIVLLEAGPGPDKVDWRDPTIGGWADRWRADADRRIDEAFFDHLFERIERGEAAEAEWIRFLRRVARETLEQATESAPLSAARTPRAVARAELFLLGSLKRQFPSTEESEHAAAE